MADFTFLKLPLEVQIEIYRLLLHSGEPIRVHAGSQYSTSKMCKLDSGYGSKGSIYSSPPDEEFLTYQIPPSHKDRLQDVQMSILSVNRQIYMDARVIFYSENCFSFTQVPSGGNSSMIPFLEDRPPESRKLIGTIQFEYPLNADFEHYSWWHRRVSEPLFKETCIYLGRHLKLKNLTLYVWAGYFNNWADDARRERVQQKYLALLPELSWIRQLALVVRNLDTLRVTVWGNEKDEIEKAIRACLESVMPETSKTVRQRETGLLHAKENSENNPSNTSTWQFGR